MVQPLFEREQQWLPSPLGRTRQDRFLCLASPELDLNGLGTENYVEWDSTAYDVSTVQSVELGEKRLYWWAVLRVRDGEP